VAIVNEQFAKHYWPNQRAVGKRFRLDNAAGKEVQVVGIAKTMKYLWISEGPLDFVYLPSAQNPHSEMTLVAYSVASDPSSLLPALRRTVQNLDRDMPVFDVRTMRNIYQSRAVATSRYLVKTVTGLGALALVLSCVGLYGIVSYAASRRTREFGIRMAVGAARSRVAGLVLREALKLGLVGIAVGVAIGIEVSDLLRTQMIFAFSHISALPFVAVAVLLLVTVCASGYAPAHRASRVDPVRALREE
jgi:ABC-type antimicrobial peptide transport system permease subunit